MEAVLILECIVRNSSAYGARNVQKVAAGTGEALPGPADCGVSSEASCSITGDPGKWVRAGWASEAAVVPVEPGGQQNRR